MMAMLTINLLFKRPVNGALIEKFAEVCGVDLGDILVGAIAHPWMFPDESRLLVAAPVATSLEQAIETWKQALREFPEAYLSRREKGLPDYWIGKAQKKIVQEFPQGLLQELLQASRWDAWRRPDGKIVVQYA